MTNKRRVLNYLWSISPEMATNAQIREHTKIASHQQVYMLTQELAHERLIQGEQRGRTRVFWVGEPGAALHNQQALGLSLETPAGTQGRLTPRRFEETVRSVMSICLGTPLTAGDVPGVPKRFDLVSPDRKIVGDAKYFTLVRGTALPPAKFSVIAEHVWLLEKTGAPLTFLVFGNARQVPLMWLKRYGGLLTSTAFYFMSDDGSLEHLAGPDFVGQSLA